jgi:hypothetical protein
MILLITESSKLLGFGIAFFFLMLGVSIIAYAIRTAECYDEPADVPSDDMEAVNYKDIMNCERPFIEHQFN